MLSLNEFSAGCLCDAKPISLFMPGSKYQPTALVVGIDDNKLMAIVLDGQHEFKAFDCSKNDAWRGMIVHPVTIEVDEKSLFDLDRFDAPLGSLTRKADTLCVAAQADGGSRVTQRWKLISGLPLARDNVEIGFTKWSVTIGRGPEKRTLFNIARPAPKND